MRAVNRGPCRLPSSGPGAAADRLRALAAPAAKTKAAPKHPPPRSPPPGPSASSAFSRENLCACVFVRDPPGTQTNTGREGRDEREEHHRRLLGLQLNPIKLEEGEYAFVHYFL